MDTFVEILAVICFLAMPIGLLVRLLCSRRGWRRAATASSVAVCVAMLTLAGLSATHPATSERCEARGGVWVEKATVVLGGKGRPVTHVVHACDGPVTRR